MKDLSFLKKNIIVHRGVHNDIIPENSIEAFKLAIEKKYIIELDVHLTSDNEVVVFHDNSLERMLGINKNIKDVTYSWLRKFYLKNSKCYIPKLSDVLELVDGKVPIIIELKYDNKVGILENEVVKILDNYKGEFAIKSFSFLSVRWFVKNRPNYVRGVLLGNVKNRIRRFFYIMFLRACFLYCKPDFISCSYKLYNNYKLNKLRNKYFVMCWTIKKQKIYDSYSKCYDNCIIENVEMIDL